MLDYQILSNFQLLFYFRSPTGPIIKGFIKKKTPLYKIKLLFLRLVSLRFSVCGILNFFNNRGNDSMLIDLSQRS